MNKEKFPLPKAFEEFSEARRAGFIKMNIQIFEIPPAEIFHDVVKPVGIHSA